MILILFTAPQFLSNRPRINDLLDSSPRITMQTTRDTQNAPRSSQETVSDWSGERVDHIFSHRAVWSTWKQCFQRVAKSK